MSRRALLGAALVAAGTSAGSRSRAETSAETPPKASQQDALYQDTPKNGLSCATCSFFRPPRACEVVAGDISPKGWCKFFDLPD